MLMPVPDAERTQPPPPALSECGYFEDRRPASNMDPYVVAGKIMETCVLPDFK